MNKKELKEKTKKIYDTLIDIDAELAILELVTINQTGNLSDQARKNLGKTMKNVEEIIKLNIK